MEPETLPLPKYVRHHVRQWADSTSVFKQEVVAETLPEMADKIIAMSN